MVLEVVGEVRRLEPVRDGYEDHPLRGIGGV